jgi:tape measure domain-containing protein
MAGLASLNIKIGAQIEGFQNALKTIEKDLRRLSSNLQSAGSTLTQAITLPLAGAGAAALSTAAKYETLRVSLSTLLGSAEKGADAFDRLAEFAAKTPFQLEDVAAGATQLLAFGLNIDEVYDSLSFLGDIAGATGSNLQDLTLIFGQARSIGAAYTEDLRQLAERGVPVFDLLSEKTGLTGDALRKFIEQGKVTFPLLQELLKSTAQEGGLFFGGMEAQSKTLTGVFSTFKDNVSLALAKIGDAIANSINLREVMGRLSDAVARAAEWFGNLSPGMQKVIVIAAGVAAALGPVLFGIGKLVAVGPVLVMGLKAIGAAFTFMTGPVGLAIVAIGAVVAGVVYAYNKFEGFRKVVNALGNTFKEVVTIIKEGASAFIRGFGELKEGEFKKAAKSFEEGIRKTNPVTLAFTEGKRLKDAFTDGFADNTNYLKKVQKEFAAATSGAGIRTPGGASPVDSGGAGGGGGTGNAAQDLQSFESRAQAVFLKLRQSAAELQTKTANALVSPLANIETLESPLKKTEAFFKTWQESVRLAGDQAALFGGTQLEIVQAQVQATGNALSLAVEQFGMNSLAVQELGLQYDALKTKLEELAAVQEYATRIQNAFASAWEAGAQAVNQAGATIKSVLKAVGRAALQAAADVVKAEIIKGVAAVISDALSKFGLLGLVVAGAAGAAAGALFQTAINKIAPPKLARGGLVTSQQLVTVGDNPSGKEAIIPFERMGEFLNMAGGGGVMKVTGLFEVRGPDLVLVLDRAKQEQLRIR